MKAVVVACNTATAAGLDDLRDELPVPVIDVIEPGARALVTATASGRVGVIGTVGTISSGAYHRAIARTGAPVSLTSAACPGFVEFVERGQTSGDEVTVLAERLLAPICDAAVDALLLGCTHYPFLARPISDVMGPGRHARQLGRRDRVRGSRDARRRSGCCATTCGPASIDSCRAATSSGSASSAPGCSAPSSTTPNPGHSPSGHLPGDEARTPMTRPDGRDADELRPDHVRTRLHRDGGWIVPRVVRSHPRAVHGERRRRRAALDARQRQGLGHGRVLDAARIIAGARRSRGGTRQAERSHRRDPTSDRSVAPSRVRHEVARRAPGGRRLRRAAGRRRHAHGQHLRRLPRAARRPDPPHPARLDHHPSVAVVLRGDQRRHRRRRSRCSTCRTSRTAGPRST